MSVIDCENLQLYLSSQIGFQGASIYFLLAIILAPLDFRQRAIFGS